MRFNSAMCCYIYFLHQHVSAYTPVIFRAMFWIKEYSCTYLNVSELLLNIKNV